MAQKKKSINWDEVWFCCGAALLVGAAIVATLLNWIGKELSLTVHWFQPDSNLWWFARDPATLVWCILILIGIGLTVYSSLPTRGQGIPDILGSISLILAICFVGFWQGRGPWMNTSTTAIYDEFPHLQALNKRLALFRAGPASDLVALCVDLVDAKTRLEMSLAEIRMTLKMCNRLPEEDADHVSWQNLATSLSNYRAKLEIEIGDLFILSEKARVAPNTELSEDLKRKITEANNKAQIMATRYHDIINLDSSDDPKAYVSN
ncbi:MAG: hypothetical protein CMI30_13075 [Opitutae bacterium]|nr:hypothetical protein [Opitutae bacterium]